ncbi:MAG: nitrogen regulation protein NR(II) [Gammaproteobacteria bacterium]|nr:nitrogen regulation protein NR(II) [Gammaproteobacteria bacterium]
MNNGNINKESELHKRVLEGMSTVVLFFDGELRLKYINPAGEMLFEQSARHMLGLTYVDLIQHKDEMLSNAWLDEIRSGQSFTRHEVSLVLFHEKEVTVNLIILPLIDGEEKTEYLLEIIPVDRWLRITRDEQRVEQQEVTQEILRGLAHEVKNPLGGLRGAAQLLERELPNKELLEYTQVIIAEADRLQALVNRILGPAGLPKLKEINIHEVLERVRSLIKIETASKIHIHRDYDVSVPEVKADPDMLLQALLNIARNACEALVDNGNLTFKTRVVRKYTIGQQRHKLVACIEVIDDGPGIPADIREKIFFPMVTSRAEGSGLGLAISQSLIQQHDGLIEFQSEPGQTIFSVILPIN